MLGLILLDLSRCNCAECGLTEIGFGQVEYEMGDIGDRGVTFGGSAGVTVDPYLYTGSGGITFGGAADCAADYDVADAGGELDFSGAAPFSIIFDVADAGGEIVFSGAADNEAEYVVDDAGGGIAFGGAADAVPDYDVDGDGGILFDGEADATIEFSAVGSGGVLFGGLAALAAHYIFASAASALVFDGEAIVRFIIDVKGLPTFLRTFDGDVRLRVTEDGGAMTIWGGQPEMDAGLETAVHLSLFTDEGWWGNALAKPEERIGSGFQAALSAPLTNAARLDVMEQARSALAWLTETGIAKSIEVDASIPALGVLYLTIRITEPDKAPALFRYSVNWREQRIHMEAAA